MRIATAAALVLCLAAPSAPTEQEQQQKQAARSPFGEVGGSDESQRQRDRCIRHRIRATTRERYGSVAKTGNFPRLIA